jgi:hypothetical protein
MKSNFFWRFGIRLIILGIFLVIAFFAAAFESLSVAGRYTDLYDLKSETLKDGGHYGGDLLYIIENYCEEGYEYNNSGTITSAYEQYYLAEVYIEPTDTVMYISISLRDDSDIARANKNIMASFEDIDANPEDYVLEFSGICEPLDADCERFLTDIFTASELLGPGEDIYDYVLPYNIRQVDAEGNGTILTIGIIVIVIFGVIITVLVKKSKQKKLEDDGTVHMDLPPEIAEAVRRNSNQTAAAPDLPDMSNIKQPDTDSFFADLDRKRGNSPARQVAGETIPHGDNRTASVNTTPAPKPSPFAGVDENAEMDELVIPEEIADDVGERSALPQNDDTASDTPVSSVGEISADEYLNKDFISQ